MGVAGLGYTGVFAVLTWQAARGQSVVHPDWQTSLAFAALTAAVLSATVAVVAAARRAEPRPPGTAQTEPRPLDVGASS